MRQRDPHGTRPTVNRLMEWMRRPEWAELYREVLDVHVSTVLEDFEIESVEALAQMIGEDLYMSAVFGATFEDFVTQPNDADETIVDEYLRRRGYRESVPGRRYLEALRDSVMSLYEVIESVPGSHLVLRDRLRGDDPVRVEERSGSRYMVKWDRLGARVFPLNRQLVMSGAPLLLEPETADLLESTVNRSVSRLSRALRTAATRLDPDEEPSEEEVASIVEEAMGEASDGDATEGFMDEKERLLLLNIALNRTAPMFTRLWLTDTLNRLEAPPPQLRNTDGEELVFVETRWPIAGEAVAAAVRRIEREEDRLLFRYSDDEWHWSWQARTGPGEAQQSLVRGCYAEGTVSIATFAANSDGESADTVSLGSILIEGSDLVLRTNSLERGQRGKAMIEGMLGDLIGPAASCSEKAEGHRRRTADDPLLPPAEPEGLTQEDKDRILATVLERHYRRWPDTALPALDGRTPREMATSSEGRARLAKLFKKMENADERRARLDGTSAYDFGWLRRELGVGEAEG